MEKAYLGIDVGSVSCKSVLLDRENNVLESCYLRNEGIIETLKRILVSLNLSNYEILGCGVTGSGKAFTGLLIGADTYKTEILAHCEAALSYYPNAKTIIDIGGEDIKLIILKNGVWTDWKTNDICGAGTGATLDAIATLLNIPIEEIGDLALQSKNKLIFSSKCGILCLSAIKNKRNIGANKEDLLMGACRALVNGYMKIVGNLSLEPDYIFQGATAQNKALVKALEEELNHKVIVPKYCSLMGAIGTAILAKDVKQTKFRGINIINENFDIRDFKCTDCQNMCDVTQLYDENKLLGAIGSKCGKWERMERKLEKQIEIMSN